MMHSVDGKVSSIRPEPFDEMGGGELGLELKKKMVTFELHR